MFTGPEGKDGSWSDRKIQTIKIILRNSNPNLSVVICYLAGFNDLQASLS